MEDQGFVDPKILRKVAVGRDYVAAKYGFRNHWYPALFSSELEEGKPQRVELLGEAVLLNRIDGQVFGMHDRCLHRGVALSRKVECYTKGTITCWYHGFTYRFSDGQLCDIVGVEKSAAIGRRALRTYPVVEAKGVIFVFIGDADFEVPPLAHDVPPRFLEDGLAIHADPATDYPFYWGWEDERGLGEGEGTTLNLPLPRGTDGMAYSPALVRALDAITAWGAGLLILSFGADTHSSDPICGFALEREDYTVLAGAIAALGIPTLVVMEGGYAVSDLGRNVASFLSGFSD